MTNGERKLRAACDRCHELKNRCTRTGGSESRCDRCERLDIDCVYNTSARIGRPRASRTVSEPRKGPSSDEPSYAKHHKRRAVQERTATIPPASPGFLETADPVRMSCTNAYDGSGAVDPGSSPDRGSNSSSPGNFEPVSEVLDPMLLPEATPSYNVNWDLELCFPEFDHKPQNDTDSIHEQGHLHRQDHPIQNLQNHYQEYPNFNTNNFTKSEIGTVPIAKTAGADKLLRLQFHLSTMLKSSSEFPTVHQPALDEVMVVCKELLELLPAPPGRRLSSDSGCSGVGPPFTPTSMNAGNSDTCNSTSHPTQKGGDMPDLLNIDHIFVLQVATSYAYALQLLDLTVDSLRTGSPALVSLGTFNLASQPAMSISIGAYMISSMVRQLHNAISLLTPNCQHQQAPPAPHVSPARDIRTTTGADNSIQAAVNIVFEKETVLLEKLGQVIIHS